MTLFGITQEVFHLICSFKINIKKILGTHNYLSDHSLQFIAIFIIKTSVLLSRVLGKKVALL